METYTDYKPIIRNSNFKADRQVALEKLDLGLIDAPLRTLVKDINRLPYIFTTQCCHGHFQKTDGEEILQFKRAKTNDRVKYRLAYIAFCIEDSLPGRNIRKKLVNIPLSIDQDKIQFFSAQWFWDQWLNSYALQVMPKRLKGQDTAQLEYVEAREIAVVRDTFFAYLKDFIARLPG